MKHLITIWILLLVGLSSCETNTINKPNYSGISEISLPTESPRGLAFDGEFLWYSDEQDKALYKVSEDGSIIETIDLAGCQITGFEFQNDFIWCINDSTVLHDTTISHYPFSCVYKYSKQGERLDSILIQGSVNPQRPDLIGITFMNSLIFISTYRGYSSCLISVDPEQKTTAFLHYHLLKGLTSKCDTIFGIDKAHIEFSNIVKLDSAYNIIEEVVSDLAFQASDLAFVGDDLWICDVENGKLLKIE
jgi:hypothetical protein